MFAKRKYNQLSTLTIVTGKIVTGKMLQQASGILNQQCLLPAVILQSTSAVG